jgi:aerobic C4-dicarboxylate transport protein
VLPRLLAKLQGAGASKQTVGLVIPTGYSFNLDGTCIYLTLGALFIVQASGQDMAIGEQIALAALMILTSKGAAGITGAGLVTLTASVQAFGGQFFSAEARPPRGGSLFGLRIWRLRGERSCRQSPK